MPVAAKPRLHAAMHHVDYQLLIKPLAERWHLSDAQYRCLLTLAPQAAAQLLAIDTTLQQLFAGSPQLAGLWMTTPNRAFENCTPMELIEHDGMNGLERVVTFLCLER